MSHLRARKQFEDLLRKRLGSLDILHTTLLRVEASAGDVQVGSYSSAFTQRIDVYAPRL